MWVEAGVLRGSEHLTPPFTTHEFRLAKPQRVRVLPPPRHDPLRCAACTARGHMQVLIQGTCAMVPREQTEGEARRLAVTFTAVELRVGPLGPLTVPLGWANGGKGPQGCVCQRPQRPACLDPALSRLRGTAVR